MTNSTPFPKISGHVFVMAHDAELLARAIEQIDQLIAFGWKIQKSDQPVLADRQIVMLDLEQFNQHKPGRAAIILCDIEHKSAIEPEGFAILSALGGGAMEHDLARSVETDVLVDKVLVGLNWTMVYAGKYCGIARSPERGTEGARTILTEAGFRKRPLRDLANMICSTDTLSRSMGLAAINAFWNRPGDSTEKSGFARFDPPGDGLVIIGGFRGIRNRLPEAKIIEREPIEGDVPLKEVGETIANAQNLAITAQTLMNGSLEPLLRASSQVKFRMLLGPSAPLCPALLKYGLDEISGNSVVNQDATEQFILETGTMIMRDDLTQNSKITKT